MVYQTKEESVHDGAPVECYRFIGSFKEYRYTSDPEQVTMNSLVYEPLAGLTRKATKAGIHSDTNLHLSIELPFDTDVVQDYAFTESPPSLSVEIRRAHRGDDFATESVIFWKGLIVAYTVQDRKATLRAPNFFSSVLDTIIPRVFYHNPCNHVLYDTHCKVVRSSFNAVTDVVSVGDFSIEVLADGAADGALAMGEIKNNRTSEKRMILDNQANLIDINFPFYDILVDDEVELAQGCNHLLTTCKTKFSNVINYGGYPFIPGENPFEGEL